MMLTNVSVKAQFSFVTGTVNTPDIPSYEIPPTDILMPIKLTNGSSMTLSATTSYNSFGNPYFIPLPSGLSIRSAKIYVDLATTQDDYVDLYCVAASDMVLVGHYLQGITSFSNHQKVAADVNIDGEIDVMDMIEMQVTILGIQTYFNNSITLNGITYNDVSAVYPTEISFSQLNNATFIVPYSCIRHDSS